MSTEVGWDGCASCFGCKLCIEVGGDCCDDCSYDSEFLSTRVHEGCPTCRCDGATCGKRYSNQVCNCVHLCPPEEAAS